MGKFTQLITRAEMCVMLRDLDRYDIDFDQLSKNAKIMFENDLLAGVVFYEKHSLKLSIDSTSGHNRIVTGGMLMDHGYSEGREMGVKMKQLFDLQDQGVLNKDNWTDYL